MLAATPIDIFDTFMGWQKANQGMRDALLVAGAAILVTTAIVLWAVFIRKRKRRPEYHEPAARSEPKPEKRRKWRRRRKDHRPRNPTLAETGGLPPVKPPRRIEPLN